MPSGTSNEVIHVTFQQVSQWVFVSHAALWLVIFQTAAEQLKWKEDYNWHVRASLAEEVSKGNETFERRDQGAAVRAPSKHRSRMSSNAGVTLPLPPPSKMEPVSIVPK